MPSPAVRPMEPHDVDAVHHVTVAAFADLARRLGEPPEPPPPVEGARLRLGRVQRTDPGGAWVAERGGEVVGASLGIVREGLWGLSLLVVRPDAQSTGIGRELLDRAHDYADGARGRVVLGSPDPRALRAYARLGLALHPAVRALGRPRERRDATGGPAGHARGSAADRRPSTARCVARRTARTSGRCSTWAARCSCSTSAATRSCATAPCGSWPPPTRRPRDAPARLPGRRGHQRRGGRVDHQRPGLGDRAVPGRRARPTDGRRRVPGRRRRPVRALPAKWGLFVTASITLSSWPPNHARCPARSSPSPEAAAASAARSPKR